MRPPSYLRRKLLWQIPLLVICLVVIADSYFPEAGLADLPGPRAMKVTWLRYRMGHGSREARCRAIWALGKLGPHARSAIPSLKQVIYETETEIGRPEPDLGVTAAMALAKMGTNATPILLAALRSGNPHATHNVVKALTGIGEAMGTNTLPILLEAVRSQDRYVTSNAVSSLSVTRKMGTNGLSILLEALRSKDSYLANQAELYFSNVGQPAARALATAIRDQDPKIAEAALRALRWTGLAAFPVLEEALQDEDPAVRQRATNALNYRYLRTDESVPELIAAAKHPRLEVRIYALMALSHAATRNGTALQTLLEAAKRPRPEERREAIGSLGEAATKDANALKALLEALRDQDGMVRNRAANALGRVGQVAISPILEVIRTERQEARTDAAFALALMGPAGADAVPALLPVFREETVGTSTSRRTNMGHTVCFALSKIGKAAIPPLLDMLKEDNTQLRAHAAAVLGQMGARAVETVPTLIRLLQDPSDSVQQAALQALGAIGPGARQAIPLLAAKLADSQQQAQQVRIAAALLKIEPKSQPSFERLLAAARAQDPIDRALALEVLGEVSCQSTEVISELLKGLADSDIRIRIPAANGFYHMRQAAVPHLVKALQDPNPDLRREAARVLRGISPESVKTGQVRGSL